MSENGNDDTEAATEAPPAPDPTVDIDQAGKFGAKVFGGFAIGIFLAGFLYLQLIDEEAFSIPLLLGFEIFETTFEYGIDPLEEDQLFTAALIAYQQAHMLSLVLAAGVGIYYANHDLVTTGAPKLAGIAAAVGTAVALVIALILLMIFEPDVEAELFDIGDELMGVIAFAVGAAVTGALVGYLVQD